MLASCYHSTEWGGTGDYRAQHSHTGEQRIDSHKVARFDEQDGIRAIVELQARCRPTLVGDHMEERQASTSRLAGQAWMVTGSLLVGLAGGFGIIFAAADANNTDIYGNRVPPRYSDSFHNQLYVGGGILLAAGLAGIVAAVALPTEKHHVRWVPVEGDPHELVTSDEPQPCAGTAEPAPGEIVHVEAKFEKGQALAWDIPTDASGAAVIDLAPVRTVAGWCGEAVIVATVLDQTWHGTTAGQQVPLDQIADEKLRSAAAACAQ